MPEEIKLGTFIVAHPEIMSGTPCVKGRRIPTATLIGRFAGGEGINDLAMDFDLRYEEVEAALRYEYLRRKNRQPEFRATREAA